MSLLRNTATPSLQYTALLGRQNIIYSGSLLRNCATLSWWSSALGGWATLVRIDEGATGNNSDPQTRPSDSGSKHTKNIWTVSDTCAEWQDEPLLQVDFSLLGRWHNWPRDEPTHERQQLNQCVALFMDYLYLQLITVAWARTQGERRGSRRAAWGLVGVVHHRVEEGICGAQCWRKHLLSSEPAE